ILDQILPGDGLVYLAKVALKKTRLENFKVVSGKKQKFFLYLGKSLYFHAAFNEKTPFFGLLVDFGGFVSLKIQLILLNDKCLCHLWKCQIISQKNPEISPRVSRTNITKIRFPPSRELRFIATGPRILRGPHPV